MKGMIPRQMSKMAHIEAMGDGTLVLFDYRHRDPLTYNCKGGQDQVMILAML